MTGKQMLQNSSGNLKILGTRRVKKSSVRRTPKN